MVAELTRLTGTDAAQLLPRLLSGGRRKRQTRTNPSGSPMREICFTTTMSTALPRRLPRRAAIHPAIGAWISFNGDSAESCSGMIGPI